MLTNLKSLLFSKEFACGVPFSHGNNLLVPESYSKMSEKMNDYIFNVDV